MKGGLRSGAIASRNYSGVRGIKNLGNTCFLNVVLQSLMGLRSFHSYMGLHNGSATASKDPRTPLADALRDSMRELAAPAQFGPYDPTPMVTGVPVLQNTFAQGQHDPEELLHHLMTILDEEKGLPAKEAGKAKEETRAASHTATAATTQSQLEKEWDADERNSNPFAGRLVSKISCKRCKIERAQTHNFIDLSLAIPQGSETAPPSLENCLNLFTKPEELTGVRCDRCIALLREERRHATKRLPTRKPEPTAGLKPTHELLGPLFGMQSDGIKFPLVAGSNKSNKVPQGSCVSVSATDRWSPVLLAEKRLSIAKSPRALCLHIQRLVAQSGFRDTTYVKRDDKVGFGFNLDLSPYCEPGCGISYTLAAVIVHHGSEDGGHFTVYRKVIESKLRQRAGWASTGGTEGDWVLISDELCESVTKDQVLKAPAYMLFYEKDTQPSTATTPSS